MCECECVCARVCGDIVNGVCGFGALVAPTRRVCVSVCVWKSFARMGGKSPENVSKRERAGVGYFVHDRNVLPNDQCNLGLFLISHAPGLGLKVEPITS